MAKYTVFLAYILLTLSLVSAATDEKVIIELGQSLVRDGKNISFIGISGSTLSFDVDGLTDSIKLDEQGIIGGVKIAVIEYSKSPTIAIINLTIDFTCGDGTCSEKESNLICCADCGCLGLGKVCQNNQCIENITSPHSAYECNTNADCTNQTCATATCDTSVTPYICRYETITACTAGDNCCPSACDTASDSDCAQVNKCQQHIDCNDENACTTDRCEGTPKRCSYTQQTGCSFEKQCLPPGAIDKGRFCLSSAWQSQKAMEAPCQENYECISGSCVNNACRDPSETGSPWQVRVLVIAIVLLVGLVVVYMALQKKVTRQRPSLDQQQSRDRQSSP